MRLFAITAATLLLQSTSTTALPEAVDVRAAVPSATIKQGVVLGTTTLFPGTNAEATKFVGIPFAKTPPKRFSPPEPAASFAKPYNAVTTMPACVQEFSGTGKSQRETKRIFNNPGGAPPAESEDCLYVNVYVPPGTTSASKKAVMFWIYGGNLAFGTGGLPFYDGSSFAATQDVIVVTHNYRTNVFGFPGSPQIPSAQQNAGFLDQRFALQWVQDNIAAFGGDATKVTIFGESAGGYSVKQLMALPPKPAAFSSAILESEAVLASNARQDWKKLVKLMHCSNAASPIKCMRTRKATAIKQTIQSHSLGFSPILNGITAVPNIKPLIQSGAFAHVPFLIGNNADEGRVFIYIEASAIDDPTANATTLLQGILGNSTLATAAINAIGTGGQTPYYTASDALTMLVFQCPVKQISALATANGYSVWRYYYDGVFPNEALFPDPGAYHSVEIPSVFGTYPRQGSPLGPPTAAQKSLSRYMQKAWADFAKNAAGGPGWSQYGSAGYVEKLGGSPNAGGGSPTSSSQLDTQCVAIDPLVTSL